MTRAFVATHRACPRKPLHRWPESAAGSRRQSCRPWHTIEMLGRKGRRRLVWACAVHDNLQIVRKGHDKMIDVPRMGGQGARNDPFLQANLLRPHVKNERLMAFADQSAKFVDRDPVRAKLT